MRSAAGYRVTLSTAIANALGFCCGAVIAAGMVICPTSTAQERHPAVAPGDQVDYVFEVPPFEGEHVTSLSSLHGRAVLVVYWTPTCSSCTGVAVPEALAHAENDSDVLAVICAGYRSPSSQGMLAFAASKGWIRPGTPAMWTSEVPADLGFWKDGMDPEGNHIRLPAVLLLDEQGRVILAGEHSELRNGGRLEDALAATTSRLRCQRVDLPPEVANAWKKQQDGNAGKAIDWLAKEADDPELRDARRTLMGALVAYWDMQGSLVRQDLARGYVEEARARCDVITDALSSSEVMKPTLQTLETAMSSALSEAEVKANKELIALRKKLSFKGPGATLAKQLEALGSKYADTASGRAAQRLALIAGGNPEDAIRP